MMGELSHRGPSGKNVARERNRQEEDAARGESSQQEGGGAKTRRGRAARTSATSILHLNLKIVAATHFNQVDGIDEAYNWACSMRMDCNNSSGTTIATMEARRMLDDARKFS